MGWSVEFLFFLFKQIYSFNHLAIASNLNSPIIYTESRVNNIIITLWLSEVRIP